ncbi:MAG: hypothetical protein PHD37_09035 [Gallionellaceae bacterium]|nr:hypothetical protein [Gallionellaceae bacterium]
MPRRNKLIAALTVLTFSTASLAQTAPPAVSDTPPQQEAEGKFVWGILIKLIAPVVFDFFSDWVKKKIAATYKENSMEYMAGNAAVAVIVNLSSYLSGKDIVLGGVSANAAPNAALGTPEVPLKTGKDGENYQGVNVALVGIDENGKPIGLRTVADGFTTGERFKLRVLSTFDAVVVLGNVTPKGAQRQIYPAAVGQAVSIPAGKEILLPLGKQEYLQFTGDVGRDQLTLTVRDPRSLQTGLAATARVFRKDESYGSNFVQEVKPGQFPVISEAIGIEHK